MSNKHLVTSYLGKCSLRFHFLSTGYICGDTAQSEIPVTQQTSCWETSQCLYRVRRFDRKGKELWKYLPFMFKYKIHICSIKLNELHAYTTFPTEVSVMSWSRSEQDCTKSSSSWGSLGFWRPACDWTLRMSSNKHITVRRPLKWIGTTKPTAHTDLNHGKHTHHRYYTGISRGGAPHFNTIQRQKKRVGNKTILSHNTSEFDMLQHL